MRVPEDSTDHFSDRSVDIKSPYGIKISKDSGGRVYLSLICFDPRTYKIEVSMQNVRISKLHHSLATSCVCNLMTRMIVSWALPTAYPRTTPFPFPAALKTVAMSSQSVMVQVVGILSNSNPMNTFFSNFLPLAITVTGVSFSKVMFLMQDVVDNVLTMKSISGGLGFWVL